MEEMAKSYSQPERHKECDGKYGAISPLFLGLSAHNPALSLKFAVSVFQMHLKFGNGLIFLPTYLTFRVHGSNHTYSSFLSVSFCCMVAALPKATVEHALALH